MKTETKCYFNNSVIISLYKRKENMNKYTNSVFKCSTYLYIREN